MKQNIILNMNGLKVPTKTRFLRWLFNTLQFGLSKNALVDAKSRVESLRDRIFARSPKYLLTGYILAARE